MYGLHGVASIGRLAGTNPRGGCRINAKPLSQCDSMVPHWEKVTFLLGTVMSLALSIQAHYSRMSGFDKAKIIQSHT